MGRSVVPRWPRRHGWRERGFEWTRVSGMASGREVVVFYVAPAATVVVPIVTLLRGDLRTASIALGVFLVVDWVLLKALDARLDHRAQIRHEWEAPALVGEAARLGLAPVADPRHLLGFGGLRLAGDHRPIGDPVTTIGVYDGRVSGHELLIAETTNRNGPIEARVIGIVALGRSSAPVRLSPRGSWTRRSRRGATALERRFKVEPVEAVGRLGAAGDWLAEHAPTTAFRSDARFLVASRLDAAPFGAEDLEPLVLAMSRSADQLDATAATG